MSRQSTAAQRNLTLTEELEKLEQSITLTLQEIDYNFSHAHRIVTTSILPIVEQYAEHSKDVWEGSKFWKHFFEASANVSLSGYEEPPPEESEVGTTATSPTRPESATPSTSAHASPLPTQETPNNRFAYKNSDLTPTPTHSTPRPRPYRTTKTPQQLTTAPYSSPYETLKRETLSQNQDSPAESTLPSTPRVLSEEPRSSPFAPPSTARGTAHRTPANDILLHRILDKNYRLQATPHSTMRNLPYRGRTQQTPQPSTAKRRDATPSNKNDIRDDDLDSSPAVPAPELHAEIFDTPARKSRIPGISVLTPGRERGAQSPGKKKQLEWDSDEDEDGEEAGLSPPKTMQFHVPQPRLLRTPAREASKRIVEDLLMTAGGDLTDEFLDEESPSVIKRGGLLEEDTF